MTGMIGANTVSTTPASMSTNSTHITHERTHGPSATTKETVSQISCSQSTADTAKATDAN